MHEGEHFSLKTLGKSFFHFQTDWSGNGLAGQFWQMERLASETTCQAEPGRCVH